MGQTTNSPRLLWKRPEEINTSYLFIRQNDITLGGKFGVLAHFHSSKATQNCQQMYLSAALQDTKSLKLNYMDKIQKYVGCNRKLICFLKFANVKIQNTIIAFNKERYEIFNLFPRTEITTKPVSFLLLILINTCFLGFDWAKAIKVLESPMYEKTTLRRMNSLINTYWTSTSPKTP